MGNKNSERLSAAIENCNELLHQFQSNGAPGGVSLNIVNELSMNLESVLQFADRCKEKLEEPWIRIFDIAAQLQESSTLFVIFTETMNKRNSNNPGQMMLILTNQFQMAATQLYSRVRRFRNAVSFIET